jgi:hypothetical protein
MTNSNPVELERALDPADRAALHHLATRMGFAPHHWAEVTPLRKVAELVTTSAVAGALVLRSPTLRRARAFDQAALSLGLDWDRLGRRWRGWQTRLHRKLRNNLPVPANTPAQFLS